MEKKDYLKSWRKKNKEKVRAKEARSRDNNRSKLNARAREYANNNRLVLSERRKLRTQQSRVYQRQHYMALREKAIREYGGCCACCGETNFCFLSIDHVNNDGNVHRREKGVKSGVGIYRFLKHNGYPKDGRFQVLCYNCNCCKQHDPIAHRKAHPNARNIDGLGDIPDEFVNERQLVLPGILENDSCKSATASKSSSEFQLQLFEQTH